LRERIKWEVSVRNEETIVFPTPNGVAWPLSEDRLKFEYDGKMLRMMDSVKMVETAVVYLKTSRTEFTHGRAAILQSGLKLRSQQCINLHYFRAPLTIASRKSCPNTFQLSRSFNSSADLQAWSSNHGQQS